MRSASWLSIEAGAVVAVSDRQRSGNARRDRNTKWPFDIPGHGEPGHAQAELYSKRVPDCRRALRSLSLTENSHPIQLATIPKAIGRSVASDDNKSAPLVASRTHICARGCSSLHPLVMLVYLPHGSRLRVTRLTGSKERQ